MAKWLVVLGLGLGLLLVHSVSDAQIKKGKTRAAETKYLMKGVVQAHCAGLGKLLKDGPKDDKEWDAALCHASVLNEITFALMDDGRCPDKAWAESAKALREASAKVADAARSKNVEECKTAFKGVTASCAGCHKAHKK